MDGGKATLNYRLNEQEGGTSFHREITFRFSNPLLRFANRVLLRRKIAAELEAGLRQLKRIIEQSQRAKPSLAKQVTS